jgi:microcystin-dependent protein
MPSANGVYSLPSGYLAVTGATILASQHNPPLEDIAAALTLRLSRDGTAPMTGPIQLASGTVTVPGGVFAADPSSGFYKTTSGIGVAISGVKVAEFLPGGVSGARFLGELIPFTGTAAPVLTVLPFGQTLSRITYAALWTFAQVEIAAGSTLYNNGDGSTTFGIPDLRGRVPAAWDSMGGIAASRLTTAGSGVNGAVLGTGAGGQSNVINVVNLPPYTPTGTVATSVPIIGTPNIAGSVVNTCTSFGLNNGTQQALALSPSFTGNAQGGTSTPMAIVQPTLITNYLLFAGA